MVNFQFEEVAFGKMMLHILKHLNSNCFGILLGFVSKDEGGKDLVKIIDCYALSHDQVLIPQLDLCLRLTEYSLKKANSELKIIGFYENLMVNFDKGDKVSHSTSSLLMCEALHSKLFKNPYIIEVLQLCGKKSDDEKRVKDIPNYKLGQYNGNNGFDFLGFFSESDQHYKVVQMLVKSQKQLELVDFDDHMLDTRADFKNRAFDDLITNMTDD